MKKGTYYGISSRSNGSEISRQQSKDVESLKKVHKTFLSADPKSGLVGEEPTADQIPKASSSRRRPKISKSRVTAQKSRNHAPDPSRAWCDDKTKLKEHQKKSGGKKGSGGKWVWVTLPTDKIKTPKPTAQKPGKKP